MTSDFFAGKVRPQPGESSKAYLARRDRMSDEKYAYVTDLSVRRSFVYSIFAADGTCLYVGRSVKPEARWRAHKAHPARTWTEDAVTFRKKGPFSHVKACAVERSEIERLQPTGNRMFTERHGWKAKAATP